MGLDEGAKSRHTKTFFFEYEKRGESFSPALTHLLDDFVHVVGEQGGPLSVAVVDVLVHDLHAVVQR